MAMEDFVLNLCGSFIRVFESRVYFIHQTAKEFLVKSADSAADPRYRWKSSFEASLSHLILAQSCVWYLCFDVFDEPWLKLSAEGRWKASPKLGKFLKRHYFLDYAAKYWVKHFNICKVNEKDSLAVRARELCRTGSNRFRSWYKVYWSQYDRGTPKTYTDLSEAAAFDLVPVLSIVLGEGEKIAIQDGDGDTPLHTACMHRSFRAARFLVDRKAPLDVRSYDGNTPLNTAAAFGTRAIAELLIKHGAELNSRNNELRTPLHRAAYFGHLEVVQILIAANADMTAKDKDGSTPADIAGLHYQGLPSIAKPVIQALEEAVSKQ